MPGKDAWKTEIASTLAPETRRQILVSDAKLNSLAVSWSQREGWVVQLGVCAQLVRLPLAAACQDAFSSDNTQAVFLFFYSCVVCLEEFIWYPWSLSFCSEQAAQKSETTAVFSFGSCCSCSAPACSYPHFPALGTGRQTGFHVGFILQCAQTLLASRGSAAHKDSMQVCRTSQCVAYQNVCTNP